MKRAIIILVILSGFIIKGGTGFAQDTINSKTEKSNFESYTDKLDIYSFGISKFNNFKVSANGSKTSLHYNPNEKTNLGLGFNYKWLGLGIGFNFGFLNSDQDLYGTTKSIDLQVDVYRRDILYSGNFQYYEGYYWKNPDDYLHNWNTADSVQIRPDIKTATLGLSGIYVFNNENFSFKAAFQNTERQIKSAGSWLLAGKFSIYGISADSSLIPVELHELYSNIKDIKGVSAINMGGAGGYAYTYLLGEYFYFSGAVMFGLNLQAVSRTNLDDENIGGPIKISTNAQVRLAIGCNKPKAFYGFSAVIDSYNIKNTEDSAFEYNYGKIRFFYGRRFDVTSKQN